MAVATRAFGCSWNKEEYMVKCKASEQKRAATKKDIAAAKKRAEKVPK